MLSQYTEHCSQVQWVHKYSLENVEAEMKADVILGMLLRYGELQRPQLPTQTIIVNEIINYNWKMTFYDKNRIKESMTTKPVLQSYYKENSEWRKE